AGVTTNVPFLAAVAGHRAFAAAEIDTGFIPRYRDELILPRARPSDRVLAFASLAVLLDHQDAARAAISAAADRWSPWSLVSGWRLNDDAFHVLRWREPGGDASTEIA